MNSAVKNKRKGIGSVLNGLGCLLTLAALISYFVYMGASNTSSAGIIVSLIAAIAVAVVVFLRQTEGLTIILPVLTAIALCLFLMANVYNFVGYFMQLTMFGDASLIGYIFCTAGLNAAALVLFLVDAFVGGR